MFLMFSLSLYTAKSINNFFSTCISQYSSYMNELIYHIPSNNNNKYILPSIQSLRLECKSFFSDTTKWKNSVHNIIFGHLTKQLNKIDNYLTKTYSPDVYWDSSHGTIPTIINNKYHS